MNFTPEYIRRVAGECNAPTGDIVLEHLFKTYDCDGSGRPDVPVYYRFLHKIAKQNPGLTMFELGFREGGASLHFVKAGGRSVGVDMGDRRNLDLFKGWPFVAVRGESTSPAAYKTATDSIRGRPDILFIDTDHTYETTKHEFEMWSPLVRSGGIVLFDDIDAPEHDCGRFFRELKGETLSLPQLHPENWGFGVYFVP